MRILKPGEWAKGRFDRWLRDYPRATPVGIFIVALGLVGASAWSVQMAGERSGRAAAEVKAAEIAAAIERQAAANSAYFQATGALFLSSQSVSPDFFEQFIDRLRIDHNMSGVIAIGWSATVNRRDVPALVAQMRASGHPDFRVHPAPRDEAVVHTITMLEPQTPSNMALVGFNMHSEARRAAAMERARRTNAIAATGPVNLIVDKGRRERLGFVVYLPVTELNGARRFKGLVYSAVRTGDFIRAAVKPGQLDTGHVEIFDITRQPAERIFSSGEDGELKGRPVEQRLDIFDQQWMLRFHPHEHATLYPLTLVVISGGVAFSMLLLAYILLVQRRNRDLQDLVAAQAERETERAAFVRELNHRVKNTLANVTSIISLTRRNARDLDSFTGSLLERVRALAASHSLLDGAQWGPTDLKALAEAQLRSHDLAGTRIHIDGPNVLVSPNDALSVGLALHELMTNATRYGALSNDEGRVDVSWQVVGPDLVSVQWRESGGPPVAEPARRGFGLTLIERALAQELGSPIAIDFLPEGLRCQFVIALRKPRSFRLRKDEEARGRAAAS